VSDYWIQPLQDKNEYLFAKSEKCLFGDTLPQPLKASYPRMR